jgi:hypothetical protein
MGLRVRVWFLSLELDRRLAEGLDPTHSPELALRAQQLRSARSRRALARGLIATVEAAARPLSPWTAAVPVVATGVLEAAGTLRRLARDLTTVHDPSVRGIALVSFLMCDGRDSPLYNRRSPVTVWEIAHQARSALVPLRTGWSSPPPA